MSRQYHQFCGLAKALDHVGERWTLLILRDMLLGTRRYSDLLNGLPGITTNLLAKRLKEMEADGLIERVGSNGYRLSEMGAALEPAIMELARWGGRFLSLPHTDEDTMNIGWGLISLKRRYLAQHPLQAELAIDERTFTLTGSPTYLAVQETPAELPDLRLKGPVQAFQALFFFGIPAQQLVDEGKLQVEGGPTAFQHFLANFGLEDAA